MCLEGPFDRGLSRRLGLVPPTTCNASHGAGSLQKRLGRNGEGPESGRSPRPAAVVWEQFEDILELLGASGPARE